MRSLLTLGVLALALPLLADEPKKPEEVKPIKVVELTRKDPVTYEKDIEPILIKKCAVCHSGIEKKGKFDVSSYESLMKGSKKGVVCIPGKSNQSRMIGQVGKTDKPFMPPATEVPLTPEELALFKLWIDQGAKAPLTARERDKPVIGTLPASVHPVRALAISADKSAVAAGYGNQIHVYDAGAGTFIRTLTDPNLVDNDKKPVKAAHLTIVEALAYSPDGKFLASGAYGEVVIWDAATGALKHKLTGFADRVVALSFSPDSKLLATGGGAPTEDGEVKVFEVASAKQILQIKKDCHSDTVFGVSFSPDGKKLATCGADKFVKVFEVFSGPYFFLSIPPFGADRLVKAFEVPSGKLLKSFEGHTHHVMDVGWKADGKLLASAGADNAVKVWDYEKGEQARTIAAHGKQVTRLLFIGNTSQFATCSGDASVRFWNVDNGGNTRNFGGSTDFLYAIGVSPDGAILAAGGEEGVVRLYNGNNAQLIKSLLPPGVEPKK
jgi:WD40 repeat protein